ncbi:MAG: hypothetical protein FWC86_05585 [Coriobacteriia bacterium]|nr:hypothetical protein [Coriobacteriia bacterium]
MFYWILCENSAAARLLRTLVQGIAGVLVVALPDVRYVLGEMLANLSAPQWAIAIVVPVVMVLLSPVMTTLGKWSTRSNPDACIVCDADGNEHFIDKVLEACPEESQSKDDYREAEIDLDLKASFKAGGGNG